MNKQIRNAGALTIFVVLLIAMIFAIIFWLNNSSTRPGPSAEVNTVIDTVDISVASTPVVQDASEINYLEDICVTASGTIADTELCDYISTGLLTFDSTDICSSTDETVAVSQRSTNILSLCSNGNVEVLVDRDANSIDCFRVVGQGTGTELGTICEGPYIESQGDIQLADNLIWTDTVGCATSSENIGVSSVANLEVCSRDNLVLVADSNNNGGSSCVSIRKNGTVSDMGKFCEDTGFTSTDEVRLAPGSTTCLDSGNASPGALTITPTNSTMLITNNDANGCVITISETDATSGQLFFSIIASNAGGGISWPDTAGVQETNGLLTGLGVWDSTTFIYAVDRWVHVGTSNN